MKTAQKHTLLWKLDRGKMNTAEPKEMPLLCNSSCQTHIWRTFSNWISSAWENIKLFYFKFLWCLMNKVQSDQRGKWAHLLSPSLLLMSFFFSSCSKPLFHYVSVVKEFVPFKSLHLGQKWISSLNIHYLLLYHMQNFINLFFIPHNQTGKKKSCFNPSHLGWPFLYIFFPVHNLSWAPFPLQGHLEIDWQ